MPLSQPSRSVVCPLPKTLTQIRATFTGLIKPSDAMKEAFNQLGIASASAGIQQFGLVGLLQKLRDEYGQNEQALGKLFPNVRNIGAVFALTGDNLEAYNKVLEATTNSAGAANAAFETATNTSVEKISRAYNKLRNALTAVASTYIDSTAALLDNTKATDVSSRTLEDYTLLAARSTAAIATIGAVSFASTKGVAALTIAARGLTTALAANPILASAAALTAVGIALNTIQERNLSLANDELDRLNKVDLKKLEADMKSLGDTSKKSFEELEQAFRLGYESIEDSVRLPPLGLNSLLMQTLPSWSKSTEHSATSFRPGRISWRD